MWRYVKEAFFVRVPVPALGDLPVNVMAVAAFGILGLANPGFWLLGVAVEAGVLSSLAFNRRFRMTNGLTFTHPGQGNPDIKDVAGPTDPQVGVLGVCRDAGRPPYDDEDVLFAHRVSAQIASASPMRTS